MQIPSNVAEDVSTKWMQTDDEFRRLVEQHAEYDQKINELEQRRFLTAEEEVEEARLKKLKLHLKDQIEMLKRSHAEPTH